MSEFRNPTDRRGRLEHVLHGAVEAVVLAMVCLSPWAFGAAHPLFEALLYAGLVAALLLWALAVLVSWRLTWRGCPAVLCLGALFVYGAVQLIDWPEPWLARLSPGTTWWRGQLLPDWPEQSAAGETLAVSVPATLTLYPAATRLELLRLLAVLLLFLLVRNTFATERSLRRLAMAAVVNGVLLTLFGLAQSSTAPGHVVYGRFATNGMAFGPFINRNHFAFYVNLCLGLGLGLLAASRDRHAREDQRWSPGDLLQRPAALGIALVLALLAAGVFFSRSRGGFVALLAGAGVYLALSWRESRRRLAAGATAVLVVLLAVGLLAWLGSARVQHRLATLWGVEAGTDTRLPLWSRTVALARQFPVWGTGYGTFETVAPLGLKPGDRDRLAATHAHNEYLEAWLEGGVVRLALSLLAIYWIYRLGLRAFRIRRPRRAGGLVLGALAAFTTAVVHGFFDFGLHLPAVAALTAVIAAHLAALGDVREPARWHGVVPPLAAALLAALGGVLLTEGYRRAQAERYRLAAVHRADDVRGSAADRARQVEYARAAVAYLPDDAALHAGLADAHLLALADALRRKPQEDKKELEKMHLEPALAHAVRARDLCPLQARAQALLASLGERLHQADPRERYLERAALLRPADAVIWYALGLERKRLGQVGPTRDACIHALLCVDAPRELLRLLEELSGKK
jgi:O-antigen ligase